MEYSLPVFKLKNNYIIKTTYYLHTAKDKLFTNINPFVFLLCIFIISL